MQYLTTHGTAGRCRLHSDLSFATKPNLILTQTLLAETRNTQWTCSEVRLRAIRVK